MSRVNLAVVLVLSLLVAALSTRVAMAQDIFLYQVVNSGPMAFSDTGFGGWSCPPGTVVIGGGFDGQRPVQVSAPGTPGSAWPHYTFGPTESGWVIQDAPDGAGQTLTVYAVCAAQPSGYQVVTSSPLAFSDTGFGGWSCPGTKVVTGGGFAGQLPVQVSAPGTPGSAWPHYTFTTDSGWVIQDAPDGAGQTLTVYAICADSVPSYQVVTSSPLAFSDTGFGGWSCPGTKVVTGGGFAGQLPVQVSAPGTPGSAWPHYTFGADSGWVIQDAPDGAGQTLTVYAICADGTAAIPTLSQWGIIFMSLVMFGAVLYLRRRRRACA